MTISWDELVSGHNCPLDAPRADDSASMLLVQRLSVSSLYLDRNQAYLGHGVLVFDPRHVTRIDQLSVEEWRLMAADLYAAEVATWRVCNADHINVVSLGNVVPHLHWHIIPRYRDDPRWREPIWEPAGTAPAERVLPEAELRALAGRIRTELETIRV